MFVGDRMSDLQAGWGSLTLGITLWISYMVGFLGKCLTATDPGAYRELGIAYCLRALML